MCGHHLVDHCLVLQQLVERAGAHGGAQRKLQLAVQVVGRLLQLGKGAQHIGVAVGGAQVQAQAHLVAGHDVLARHLHGLQAQVHQLHGHSAAVLPEGVGACGQQALHFAIHRQQRALALGHLHLQHAGQSGHAALAQLGVRQSRHQCGG